MENKIGWIKVSDKMPKPHINVLVSILYGSGSRYTTISFTTKRFPDIFEHFSSDRITHWMPLPDNPI